MNDWIESTIELQPNARLLTEHLNRKEYDEAYMLSIKIEQSMRKLREWINAVETPRVP